MRHLNLTFVLAAGLRAASLVFGRALTLINSLTLGRATGKKKELNFNVGLVSNRYANQFNLVVQNH